MTLIEWGNQLVFENVPFKAGGRSRDGIDCLGVGWLAHKEVYNIDMPSYTQDYSGQDVDECNFRKIGELIEGRLNEWVSVDKEQEGDFILLKVGGGPFDVGLVVGQGLMLHIEKGINVCYESYKASQWRNRIYGFFRHPSRCGNTSV